MPTLIIAEIGSVHDGSFGNALHLIDTAAECGASAAKFQTHISEAETLPNAPQPPYFKGEPRFEYFQRTGFTEDQWRELKARCDEQDVLFLSSPFSVEAVELLERINIEQYKIPSGEVTNLPMLDAIAQTGKPILLSSGMSSWEELDMAVETIRQHHNNVTVLQCTSEYPCPNEQVGLNVMLKMKHRYHLPIGLSDHTLENYSCFAAVTLGATVIEKHLTFSRRMYGSDARHSLEPEQFKDLVQGINAIETMLDSAVDKDDIDRYQQMKDIFQKSVTAKAEIPAGATISAGMLAIRKPGTGIPAARIDEVIGKQTAQASDADTVLDWSDLKAA